MVRSKRTARLRRVGCEGIDPYDLTVRRKGSNRRDQCCWSSLPRLAGEYDLGYAKANGKCAAKLIDREPAFEVVTGSTRIDDVGSPLAAAADRHLVLGLEWALSPAAIPASAAL
jgi:hypothetical protein